MQPASRLFRSSGCARSRAHADSSGHPWFVLSAKHGLLDPDDVVGPFDVEAARPFTADPDLFAAPLVQRRDGSWVLIGFHNLEAQGGDGFEICDPIPVELDDEGSLVAG